MAYKATGRLHKIFETEQKSASFSVRDFVIEVADDKFPQMVKFQLTQDKCALIDDYSEGDVISVDFDLRGREWNDKYFTNLNAWRIAQADAQDGTPKETDATAGTPAAVIDDLDDDIPF
jgi:single-strand DNA-binding protein